MVVNGLKRVFLKGRYADLITVTTALAVVLGFITSLAYVFPPSGLLLLLFLFYSLKYLWLYDGTNFRWRNMKTPEKGGTLAALLGIGIGVPYLIQLREPLFAPMTWSSLVVGIVTALFVSSLARREDRLGMEDFFIAGWSAGAIGAVSIIVLSFAALAAHSEQQLLIVFSPTFFSLIFQSTLYLILTLGISLGAGYGKLRFGRAGSLVFTLVSFGLYAYILQAIM